MLFSDSDISLNDQTWRRINMRKVSHLIGAEMIHNLYERHWARINSLYFRHTITNFKEGTVESYAPVKEWSYLQHWLSEKFINEDAILIREIEAILHPKYEFVHEIIKKVDQTDLQNSSNKELALLLIDIMDYPLGEIYKLNVVQIEYSLNFAIHKLLGQYEPNEQDRNELLARLIAPGQLTVAQEEEVVFGEIMTKGRSVDVKDPQVNDEVMDLLRLHHKKYSPTHCAYGENPPGLSEYINKYIFMYDKPGVNRANAMATVNKQREASAVLLERLSDKKLTRLCNLMAEIGVFRDWNKAKLGETVVRRIAILNEIARRTKVSLDDINLYLMAELTNLLDTGKELPFKVLEERRQKGVSFTRSEDVHSGVKIIESNKAIDSRDTLKGICASSGKISGVVKVILDKNDISKMNAQDIMVAVGTDFDLLEIMNLSAGIITEEGGLLSHASVVSRELKKPCLIGVNGATTLLSDGDEVILDATLGEINILKRKNRIRLSNS